MKFDSLRSVVACLLLSTAVLTAPTAAEEIITLRSGATLQGVATMDGEDVVVTVGESVLRTPFTSVASIHSGASGQQALGLANAPAEAPADRGTELLVRALEAKLQAAGSALGLLTEAYQISPDDPRVAYWYASELIASGHGGTANEVMKRHGKSIARAYPAFSQDLDERLQ
ncbi:hypothetical protein Pla123a_14880 [Posidoniimonas polymericola]|uniref:Uncharacterized protein n=1 Tax=Posidoniimonas polymericola TaxID=2528002 RepID=A0A5C5YRX7_9BACT|nr:hypothetical protein [Posidoniimonas polymericola]TWT77692.1 hypothetical protein Pla123a_14880 [Posidoniimonas polymericola]